MMLIFALFGCTQEPAAPPPAVEPVPTEVAAPAPAAIPEDVAKAATIGRALEKEPTRIDAILQENGTTREAYEALLYEIANDPARSEAYARAMEGG